MKKKLIIKFIIPTIVIILCVACGFLGFKVYSNKTTDTDGSKDTKPMTNDIPDGYIAVFNGGAGEITYSTYIYKIDNGNDNSGFEYINTTNTTESWGSSNWVVKVTSKGKVDAKADVFKVAEDNYAYSYVQVPGEDDIYTIDEYRSIFLKK